MGRSSIEALHQAGHDVVGLVRTDEHAARLAATGAQPWKGDLYDRPTLTAGMKGCDAVANLATKVPVGSSALRPGSFKAMDRIRLHGSRVVADAARRADVGRIVQQSLSFIYADHGDDWIDERSAVDVSRASEPVVVGEDNVRAFADQGGVAISLRFGLITGEDANTAWLFRRAAAGRSIGLGEELSWMHVVHPDDIGTAVVHALVAPGGHYNVGSEPVHRCDYVDTIARAAGRTSGRFLPGWVLRVGGQQLEILTRSHRVSSQLFSDRTGWQPRHPHLTPAWFDELVEA
ncbi:epimerase [Aeromicrobium chenweiae]|uniref:Epimerase n=2 Tax=Aeromicrobium chenweiae TaxID=2079793 RepID=A0A2S0WJA5_9ACTN|nr:epimerase [Aeromicrobium chenweiae]